MNRAGLLSVVLAVALALMGSTTESLARTQHHYYSHRAHVHVGLHHKRHHHSKVKKVSAIGTPIAIGAAFGPAGSVGYQAVKRRRAIKRHLFH
jgi:hypothetical protein